MLLLGVERPSEVLVRDRIREHVAQGVANPLPEEARAPEIEKRLDEWIRTHPERYADAIAAVTGRLRADLSYEDGKGRLRPYLGDVDSYAWLRQVRTYLRSGTTCDAVVEGVCRDELVFAPVGSRMPYPRSLHIVATVAIHRLIEFFRPDQPLMASAMWVPAVAGTVGAIPAFALGFHFAGPVGGFVGGVMSALHPQYLLRTIGADNDVWNVVLPLLMMASAIAALDARRGWSRILLAATAGVIAGLHAATWSGWMATVLVLLAGLGSGFAIDGLTRVLRGGVRRARQEIRWAPVGVFAIFLLGLLSTLVLIGVPWSALWIPAFPSAAVIDTGIASALSDRDLWPDPLLAVAEAAPTDAARLFASFGEPFFVLVGVIGALWLLADLAIPPRAGRSVAPAAIVLLWLLGGAYLASSAARHAFLLGPPFAIASAVAIGRSFSLANGRLGRTAPPLRRVLQAVLCLALAIFLWPPVRRGTVNAAGYLPTINDAWFDSLTSLREGSARDAIVHASWEFGYWVKFVAERRTSVDGASLRTHVPYWLARAQTTASDVESAGILRMLSCGSDATPYPEGRLGAYGKLRAKTDDPLAAQRILLELVALRASEAAARLAALGFSVEAQADVLRSTHCTPPETLWMLSTRQRPSAEHWLRTGSWSFERALILHRASHETVPAAVADIGSRLGLEATAIEGLVAEAKERGQDFVVPPAEVVLPYGMPAMQATTWHPCAFDEKARHMRCALRLVSADDETAIGEFAYDLAAPQDGHFVQVGTDRSQITGDVRATPGMVLSAGRAGIEAFERKGGSLPALAVLVDRSEPRILVGTPAFLRSTFVHLVYLGGRYTTAFEKRAERTGLTGERVQTWKLRWDQQ